MVYIFRVVSERRGKGALVSGIDLIMPRREHPGGRHASSGGKPSLQCVYPPLVQGRSEGGAGRREEERRKGQREERQEGQREERLDGGDRRMIEI